MGTTTQTPDIFDQLAANQKTSSPTTKPQPSPSQPQDIFDQLATGGDSTTVPSSNPSGQTEPGLLNRLYETSGAKGMVELGKQAFQRPIDRYHEAVDAAQKGDWIGATEAANNLINGGITDKDNPLYKAAEAIIMHPIDEIKATYKENRKAGGGVNDLANSYRDLKGRISKDAATGNIAGVTGDLAGTLDSHEMGSIPVLGSAIQQEGGNLDTDLHDRNYRAIAGDILGPLLTFGLGKTISSLGDAADAINTVKPATAEIAGEDVPIASNNPQLAGEQSTLSRLTSRVATKKGAEQFVKDQVQPAAVRATQSNFTRSALDAVDELRSIRGEAPVSATPPVLHSVDDIAKLLQNEASTTYNALDEAGQPDVDAWDKKFGKAETTTDVPPRPKLFTELQDQLNEAKDTLRSKLASQTDKAVAKTNLPQYQKEMNDFVTKHKTAVGNGELEKANQVWAQSQRYKWIANKIRPALKGSGSGNVFNGETPSINPTTLRNMPALFDNKFGDGAFTKLLGADGMANYNDVLNALVTPTTGGTLADWISKLPLHVGELAKAPVSSVADKLLFDPKAGQTALTLWRQGMRGAGKAIQAMPAYPGQREAEIPVLHNGQLVGFTLPNKNGMMRPIASQ